MLKTVEEVKQKYPRIRVNVTWDETTPALESGNTGAIDLTGQTFGRVTVLEKFPFRANKRLLWIVECSCDKHTVFVTSGRNLRHGDCTSCGCVQSERAAQAHTKHGLGGKDRARIYTMYNDMIHKCYDEKRINYKNYGAKGITVCDEWQGEHGLDNFVKWAYDNGYYEQDKSLPRDELLSLRRIDETKGFYPDNCVWSSGRVQPRYTEQSVYFDIAGVKIGTMDLMDKFGITIKFIHNKIGSSWSKNQVIHLLLHESELGKAMKRGSDLYIDRRTYELIPDYSKLEPWSNDPMKRNLARGYLTDDILDWILDIKKNTKQ